MTSRTAFSQSALTS